MNTTSNTPALLIDLGRSFIDVLMIRKRNVHNEALCFYIYLYKCWTKLTEIIISEPMGTGG